MDRIRICLAGAFLAVTVAGSAALADTGDNSTSGTNSSTNTVTTDTVTVTTQPHNIPSTLPWNWQSMQYPSIMYVTILPEANRAMAAQSLLDAKINNDDISAVLPLLMDLRTTTKMLHAKAARVTQDLLVTPSEVTPKMTAQELFQQAATTYQDHQNRIWNTITEYIGADKAGVLRNVVQGPPPVAMTDITVTSDRMRRITQMVADLDRMSATKAAGTNTSDNGTVNTSDNSTPADSTSTTSPTTTVTQTSTTYTEYGASMPVPVFTPGLLSMDDLIDLLSQKLVATSTSPGDAQKYIIMAEHSGINNNLRDYLWDAKMHRWD